MVRKIPIVGVENAGKTSLIATFQREFQTLSKIKPTKGIDRTILAFFNNEVIVWDLAGQVKFRKQHIEKADMIFTDFEDLFYVVDLQDQSNFEISINYFQMIRQALLEYCPEATINFIINKLDPGMEKESEIMKLAETVAKKFTELSNPVKSRTFFTSIFNPISVLHAFSKAFIGNNILSDNFDIVFSEFITKNAFEDKIEVLLAYSSQFLEMGHFFSNSIDHAILRDSAMEIFKNFDSKKVKLQKADITLQSGQLSMQLRCITVRNKEFYLIVGYNPIKVENPSVLFNKIDLLEEEVNKLILYF